MRQTLLVPLDGSEAGEASLGWALHLARVRGLALALARVVPDPYVATTPFGVVRQ